MNESLTRIAAWLEAHPALATLLGTSSLLLAAALSYFVVRRYLTRAVTSMVRNSRFSWDDVLLQPKVLRRAAALMPLVVLHFGLPLLPGIDPEAIDRLLNVMLAAMVFVVVMLISAILTATNEVYSSYPVSRGRPIKGYLQIAKIFLFIMAVVFAIALVLDRSPLYLLTGIGAMTAVVLLIFRDTILSLVASIQIASNDMVRIGDWIEMPKYGADGDVIDIALHTVKVQNWDKTITTIPTYKLIDESFRNWRGMQESGGRRIKRPIHIDMRSIRFLDQAEIERFERFVLLRDYIAGKRSELEEYNKKVLTESDLVANARRLTNVGTFRAYVVKYLQQRPDVHSAMTFLVRHLEPGSDGLPLEIYVFTKTTAWAEYEAIQADVFDHLLAILPEFGLRVFQNPTGHDFERMREAGIRDQGSGGRNQEAGTRNFRM
ncbi:MAG: mechanosensitive ion channel family protein [Acidobacteria bacterium]|nr:mechanosensitive ion channel family protein [Acidobacteriota bacterium]